MALEITGKLIAKLDMQSGTSKTGNNWQKQEFVIETLDQYPQKVCSNLWGDKTNQLNQFNIGDLVKVSFDLNSREFNGKWYTDVRAWRIEPAQMAGAQGPTSFDPSAIQTQHTAYSQPTTQIPASTPINMPVETTFTDMGDGEDLLF